MFIGWSDGVFPVSVQLLVTRVRLGGIIMSSRNLSILFVLNKERNRSDKSRVRSSARTVLCSFIRDGGGVEAAHVDTKASYLLSRR